MSLSEFYICWKVENYLLSHLKNKNCFVSPTFSKEDTIGHLWDIKLYPTGLTKKNEGYFSLLLRGDICEITDLRVMLCNADNKVIVEFDGESGERNGLVWLRFNEVLKSEELEKEMKECSNDCLTVRCKWRMKKKFDVPFEMEKYKAAKTIIEFDKSSFDWNINFDNSSNILLKKAFTDMNTVTFETVVKAPGDEVLIEIRRMGTHNRDHKVKCQIFLLDDTENEILSSEDYFFFDHKFLGENVWHFPLFFKKSILPKDKPCGNFKLRFNFFISNGRILRTSIKKTNSEKHNYSNKIYDNRVLDSLLDDYHAILSSKKYTDVKFVMSRETITAHKNILASRSPVLSAMFDQQNTIEITDFDADIMKSFLKFLYTGMLDELDSKRMMDLLMLAQKYQVPLLKDMCSEFLALHVNTDNVCYLVSVADKLGLEILKAVAMNYIKEHTKDVLGSSLWPMWCELNVKLSSEIICKFSNIIKSAK